METRILVPLDGSPLAEQALDSALEIAKQLDATVVLIRANVVAGNMWDDDPSISTFQEIIETEDARNRDYLQSIVQAHPGHKLETIVVNGVGGMITYAKDHEFDLVVISTKGQTGFTRWWLGSVAERFIRYCGHSVLVVRGHTEQTERPSLFGKVLVPLDGSSLSELALEKATSFVHEELILFQCLDAPGLQAILTPARYEQTLEGQSRAAQCYLEGVAKDFSELAVTRVLGRGRAATEIVKEADERAVNLIVMTTHGQGRQRWFLGSVAESVVKEATVPVLVVRAEPTPVDLHQP